jgi:hypothetical protein
MHLLVLDNLVFIFVIISLSIILCLNIILFGSVSFIFMTILNARNLLIIMLCFFGKNSSICPNFIKLTFYGLCFCLWGDVYDR